MIVLGKPNQDIRAASIGKSGGEGIDIFLKMDRHLSFFLSPNLRILIVGFGPLLFDIIPAVRSLQQVHGDGDAVLGKVIAVPEFIKDPISQVA